MSHKHKHGHDHKSADHHEQESSHLKQEKYESKPKSDDRSDNVDRIQYNINHTIKNMELAEEMIERTDGPKTREDLKAKNERRRESLDSMRVEIRDEARDKKQGYK